VIISRTPLRISFLGGGTDYPEFFNEHGGEVLTTAIDKFVYITVTPLTDFFNHKLRISYSKTELVERLEDVQHRAFRECLRYAGISSHVEVTNVADLPARTGLGSSASFVVALLHALHTYKCKAVPNEQLAYEAIEVEKDILKETVGCQDQAIAAVGGFQHIQFHSRKDIRWQPVILHPERRQLLDDSLMMFFTGIERSASEVAGEQISRSEINVPFLKDMKSLVREGMSSLQSTRPLSDFGRILHESWVLKKSLSDKIASPIIDDIYERGIKAGAVGGKLLGAGAGGFMLFLVEDHKKAAVRSALSHLREVPFNFEPTGSQIIYFRPPTPHLSNGR
jgi:D-glycero-alpha-D-manno-heptose-7-phosphate kinase